TARENAGGSAYGLDAASGVVEALRAEGRGYQVGETRVPIVPSAILFDLLNGGDKAWLQNPYGPLGAEAFGTASVDFETGSTGAGTGATTRDLKGGLGTASVVTGSGYTVGSLVAVNAVGTAVQPGTGRFWAGVSEFGDEFGGQGCPQTRDPGWEPDLAGSGSEMGRNTTIGIVATDVAFGKAELSRIALGGQDGFARSLRPSHTLFDGDLVFAASSGMIRVENPAMAQFEIGHAAAECMARAVANGVFSAAEAAGDHLPVWQSVWGRGTGCRGSNEDAPE
ncbi:MAG: P1 family peptidase, partial [Rhodobacteraceae bacterium]|nr:P1 family peptidase [Paracoccaceae bacterium]